MPDDSTDVSETSGGTDVSRGWSDLSETSQLSDGGTNVSHTFDRANVPVFWDSANLSPFLQGENFSLAWDGVEETLNTSTNNITNISLASALDPKSLSEYQTAALIWRCVSPVLLLLGGFGNIATILVLWRMKRSPSTQPLFLMAVAISDLCLLYSGLFLEMCLYLFHLDLKNMHSVPCTGFLWLSLAANSTSAWLLVTVTAQRAVCVALPYRMRSLFSRRRSEFAIAAVAAAAAILHSHVFYGMHVPAVNPGHCTAAEDYHHFWDKVWSWIDLCVSSLIPSLILFCCNLFLIWALRRRVRSAAALSEGNAPGMDARRKAASSTTITVLLLSFTFLVLTIPYYAFLIWSHPVNEESAPELQARVKLIWTVTSLMWYGNSAVNFLLYCVSGSKFRAEFLRWLRCSSTQDTPSNSVGRRCQQQSTMNGHANGRHAAIYNRQTPIFITTRL